MGMHNLALHVDKIIIVMLALHQQCYRIIYVPLAIIAHIRELLQLKIHAQQATMVKIEGSILLMPGVSNAPQVITVLQAQ